MRDTQLKTRSFARRINSSRNLVWRGEDRTDSLKPANNRYEESGGNLIVNGSFESGDVGFFGPWDPNLTDWPQNGG